MINDPRIIHLYWKKINSPYGLANKEQLVDAPRLLGSSITVTNTMLAGSEEQSILMKEVIGLSSNSPQWDTKLAHYWNSVSEIIDSNGRDLEVGFSYDVTSIEKKKYIDAYNASVKEDTKIKSDIDIKNYFDSRLKTINEDFDKEVTVSKKISNSRDQERFIKEAYDVKYKRLVRLEGEKYKFGNPISVQDYMLYRMCLIHSQVANEFSLVDKSINIRFYLHSEADVKAYKEETIKLEKDRMNAFLSVVVDPNKVENILYALNYGDVISSEDASDRTIRLNKYSVDNPKKFISVANDSRLETIGLIEKYVSFGILRKLESSQVIVDGLDVTKTIGNDIDEAVNYFKNETNKASISEFAARFKGLPKQ